MNLTPIQLAENWFAIPSSNISFLIYSQFGQQVAEYQESIRKRFVLYCNLKLNLYSIEDLIKYYDRVHKKKIIPESAFIDITELEFILSEVFQSEILKMSNQEILQNRFKWSFKSYLKNNNGFYDPDYIGTMIKYQKWYHQT